MRVQEWYLAGQAQSYRQNILLSSLPSPHLNAIFNAFCSSHTGKIKLQINYQVRFQSENLIIGSFCNVTSSAWLVSHCRGVDDVLLFSLHWAYVTLYLNFSISLVYLSGPSWNDQNFALIDLLCSIAAWKWLAFLYHLCHERVWDSTDSLWGQTNLKWGSIGQITKGGYCSIKSDM